MSLRLSALDLARTAGLYSRNASAAQGTEHSDKPAHLDSAGLIAGFESRIARLRQEPGNLQQLLNAHLQHRHQHNKAVMKDWISETPYAAERKAALGKIAGAENIAAHYGLSNAETINNDSQMPFRQLRLENDASSPYARTLPDPYHDACLARYVEAGGNRGDNVLFVNGRLAGSKLLGYMKPHLQDKAELKPVGEGIMAVVFNNARDQQITDHFVTILGSRPSAYRALEGSNGEVRQRLPDYGVDTQQQLHALRDKTLPLLGKLPADHGHKALNDTILALLNSLIETLDPQCEDAYFHDPILSNGLQALTTIAERLPGLHHDSQQFANAYSLLMEEMLVCLSAVKPYGEEDFHKAASAQLAGHCLPAHLTAPTMHLTTSGMAAISHGIRQACDLTGETRHQVLTTPEGKATPLYFELNELPKTTADSKVLLSSLNASTPAVGSAPEHNWGPEDVIAGVKHHLAQQQDAVFPSYLVLDATVEQRGDMEKVVRALAPDIDAGRLKIFVGKSYQKHASLSSAKVMAGGIGLLSNDDDQGQIARSGLAIQERILNWIDNPESQLMTHMLKNREREFDLLERATGNARFVAENFFNGKGLNAAFAAHENTLPFAIIHSEQQAGRHMLDLHLMVGSEELNLQPSGMMSMGSIDHLYNQLLPMRFSFGFATTTMSPITSADEPIQKMRLSFGQETRGELAERFYMPAKLMHLGGSYWSCPKAYVEMMNLVEDALRQHPLPPELRGGSLESKLMHIAQAEQASSAPISADDHSLMQQQQAGRDTQGLTLPKIASVVLHLAQLLNQHADPSEGIARGPDRGVLDDMLKGLIRSGMPGISTPTRDAIFTLQANLRLSDMGFATEEEADQQFKAWLDDMDRMPGSSSAHQMPGNLPEEVFERASPQDQERLVNHVMNSMAVPDLLSIIGELTRMDIHHSLTDKLLTRMEQPTARPAGAGTQVSTLDQQRIQTLRQQRSNGAATFWGHSIFTSSSADSI
ncbi:hypothetical protein ACKC9G_17090 [Pokkaliibacter sp. CJK22405]|uniref:hypothetical protein n=1 Tax=Pokkaliibacter sp. CJK22405 TaxID=3384615 RepID=UPI003984B72F